jgi:serine/threonine-protein kinase
MLTGHDREPSAQRIGPYEALLDIGSGGMGTISLARATGQPVGVDGFARLVALKRPLGALASDPEVMQRFLDEARLLAQIHHVNVVGVHQIGGDSSGHFLVLDYIEGGTLDEMISRQVLYRKKMPPPIVLRIMCDVLAGLHAVHEAADVEGRPLCMLHRDVSTHNVLVGRDGVARVADFGIAKAIISSTVTDKAYLQGRIPYMAPEYLRRDSVDRRLDVYAAGITMWTALAGRLPWADAAEAQIVKSIVFDGVPPLRAAGVTVAPAVEEIVGRACARDPAERFASAREMLETIEDVGRRTGWMGSHAEVAAFVEELLGRELRARRAAIARRLASLEAQARAAAAAEQGAASGGAGAAAVASAPAPVIDMGAPSSPVPDDAAPNTLPSGSAAPNGSATGASAIVTTPSGARVPFQSAPDGRAIPAAPASAPSMEVAPMAASSQLAVSAAILPRAGAGRGGALGRVAVSLGLVLLAGCSVAIWKWRTHEEPSQLVVPAATAATATAAPAAMPPPAPSSSSPAPSSSSPSSSSPAPSSSPSTTSEPPSAGPGAPRPSQGARPPRVPPRAGSVPSALPTAISTSNPYR